MQNLSKLTQLRQFKTKIDQEYQTPIDVDRMLKSLQDSNIKHRGQRLNINQKQFISLCRMGRNLLLKQPSLLRLNGPIFIATGTVGYYKDLVYIMSRCGHPDLHNYLFIGDYIGRGDRNIQCLVMLMCLKIKLQNNFFMIRGCHDSIAMARSFNFYDQCIQRFTPKAWAQACQFLCSLPFAAIVQNQIFCCHGGLSPSLKSVQQINRITRPLETPQIGLACDLVWADPSYKEDSLIWSESERGFSYNFHQKVADHFIRQNRFSLICRGHQVMYDGFYMNKDKTIATICSLANYGGIFNNSAAVLVMNPQYQVYFKVIKQRQHFPIELFFHDSASSLLKKAIQQKRLKRKKQQQQRQKQMKQQSQSQLVISPPSSLQVIQEGQQKSVQTVQKVDSTKASPSKMANLNKNMKKSKQDQQMLMMNIIEQDEEKAVEEFYEIKNLEKEANQQLDQEEKQKLNALIGSPEVFMIGEASNTRRDDTESPDTGSDEDEVKF